MGTDRLDSSEVPANVEVVDLTPELWEVYKEIRLRGLQEDPQAFGRSYEEELAFPDEKWKERADNKFNTLAMERGKPIGTMGAYISKEDGVQVAYIVGVYVVSEARGKKVGSLLMQRVLEKIELTPNVSVIRLSVNKDQLAAVGLYERFGFKITGEKRERMGDGKEHNELVMEKCLN